MTFCMQLNEMFLPTNASLDWQEYTNVMEGTSYKDLINYVVNLSVNIATT